MSKSEKPNNPAAELARKRWAKTTQEERSAHARMMVTVRERKRQVKRDTAGSVAAQPDSPDDHI